MSGLLLLLALSSVRHPIHSSSAAVSAAPGGVTALVVLRVFNDDFPPGRQPGAVAGYLDQRFRIFDAQGRRVALRVDALHLEGLVLVIELSAQVPEGLSGARIWHGVLAERFSDQVNLVRARYGSRSVSLLFTGSDGPKPLP